MKQPGWILGVALCLTAISAVVRADDLADARAALDKVGARALGGGIVLESESEFVKELPKSALLHRNLVHVGKELKGAEQKEAKFQAALTQLKQQHVALSAQLANVAPNNVSLNNRLVGALNAIKGQHDLYETQRDKAVEEVKAARAKMTAAREAYLQYVLDTRKLADQIAAEYEAKSADPAVKQAIASYNKAVGKQLPLAPGAGFQASLKHLKQLEDTILSEAIELRDDGSKTFLVNVVVNGKVKQEMVLDSGASLISLPPGVAASFGLRPTDKDPRLLLQLADGRQIEGRKMTIPSVRVGKFTVENVDCVVLGEEAAGAPPLLGMSFLEHFKFEVDASAKTLTMVKVAGADTSSN